MALGAEWVAVMQPWQVWLYGKVSCTASVGCQVLVRPGWVAAAGQLVNSRGLTSKRDACWARGAVPWPQKTKHKKTNNHVPILGACAKRQMWVGWGAWVFGPRRRHVQLCYPGRGLGLQGIAGVSSAGVGMQPVLQPWCWVEGRHARREACRRGGMLEGRHAGEEAC
jgi:hypothetical protein